MICPNCNSQVPNGGFFCPECGTRIPVAAAGVQPGMPRMTQESEIPVYTPPVPPTPPVYTVSEMSQSSLYAPSHTYRPPVYTAPVMPEPSGTEPLEYIPPVTAEPAKPKKEKKAKKEKIKKASSGRKAGGVILTVLLVILLLGSLGLNAWQYMSSSEKIQSLEDQIADSTDAAKELNNQIADLEKNVEDRDAVIREQSSVINELEPLADNYETIIEELSGYNVGFAANNFSVNRGAIVISLSEQTKQFYLTANWPSGGTVSLDLSSDAASVGFDNDSWDNGTTMTVTAQKPGVCIATFSNNVDDKVFKVLIIVTE